MKAGEKKYWTPPREKALLKLGKKAETDGKYKDWTTARELCPKEGELMKKLAEIWNRRVNGYQ